MEDYRLLTQKLDDHIKDDDRRFGYMEDNVINTRNDVKEIKDNHLVHVQKDVAEIKIDFGRVKTDVAWLKKFFWIVAAASVGSLVAGLINLIIAS